MKNTEKLKTLKYLIGKKIINAEIKGIKNYDDKPYLDLEFSDGTKIRIIAYYGGYTGRSEDEYPRVIKIEKIKEVELK